MNSLKTWIRSRDLKLLFFGLFLLICSVLSLIGLMSKGFESFYVSGLVLFTIFGLGFIRKSKKI